MTSSAASQARTSPPVLSGLLRGSLWLALRVPILVVTTFVSLPLTVRYIGEDLNGAYGFAWSFGFIQFLLEFGMSSALLRQVSDFWARDDREGVNRSIACGTVFYAALAVLQATALLGIAACAVPHSGYAGAERRLIVQLLVLQAATAPCFGLSTVVNSVLQAARRYEFVPRLELLIVLVRFALLVAGYEMGVPFIWVVVAQVAAQIGLGLLPALWVMTNELGYWPRVRGWSWKELRGLTAVSAYFFLIQLSVVLGDKLDTTVLGFALPEGTAGRSTTIYMAVSKPFAQVRQTGWMLTYLVMPAVASLAAAGDQAQLERLKYDGTRFLVGLLLPVGALAAIDAAPFLSLWMGSQYATHAGLLQLFLIATIPLIISVLVQICIGIGRFKMIALAALLGSMINLPVSYILTVRIGVAGVIWGTVLTTLISNLLVPGWYAFRVLEVRPRLFLGRSLAAPMSGLVVLLIAIGGLRTAGFDPNPLGATAHEMANFFPFPSQLGRSLPFVLDLMTGVCAYASGYALIASGRNDMRRLARELVKKCGPHRPTQGSGDCGGG